MIIAGRYSFNRGDEVVQKEYAGLLREVEEAIWRVNAESHRTKASQEKTKRGKWLYSPTSLNGAIKELLQQRGWQRQRVEIEYSSAHYTPEYQGPIERKIRAYREMDFVKEKLRLEVQFKKYAFMVYNVAAKMTIFRNLGHIEVGIEVVPIKQFAEQMSSGVSYFEQFVWDLEQRGVSDIDIPVLILGVDSESSVQHP
ncbi:MAG: restriction endonuclease [Cyanobacteria bacterium M5B4]|nr:MAG: restriction endonuclease [Cyanobacteria bacterium M5B4]